MYFIKIENIYTHIKASNNIFAKTQSGPTYKWHWGLVESAWHIWSFSVQQDTRQMNKLRKVGQVIKVFPKPPSLIIGRRHPENPKVWSYWCVLVMTKHWQMWSLGHVPTSSAEVHQGRQQHLCLESKLLALVSAFVWNQNYKPSSVHLFWIKIKFVCLTQINIGIILGRSVKIPPIILRLFIKPLFVIFRLSKAYKTVFL